MGNFERRFKLSKTNHKSKFLALLIGCTVDRFLAILGTEGRFFYYSEDDLNLPFALPLVWFWSSISKAHREEVCTSSVKSVKSF